MIEEGGGVREEKVKQEGTSQCFMLCDIQGWEVTVFLGTRAGGRKFN